MKKTSILSLAFVAGFALIGNSAFGANAITYTAHDYPGAADDSTASVGTSPTKAWTAVSNDGTPNGGGGNTNSEFGTHFGTPMWGIWDYAKGGDISQTNTFLGGALQVGQSVSLEYATASSSELGTVGEGPGSVGLNLLSGSTTEVSIFATSYTGNYDYTDSTTLTGVSTGQAYNPNNLMDFSFEVTGADTYQADLNGHTWDGTFSAPITGIQVFDDNGGNGSDQYSADLTVVPEPSTYALMLGGLGLLVLGVRRRLGWKA